MNDYYFVGSISEEVSKESGLPAGTIVINKRQLEHIQTKHSCELDNLGINAFDYVRLIADNYDAIVDNKDGSYKLVKTNNSKHSDTFCMIELTVMKTASSWKWLVVTSQPQRKPFNTGILGKRVIWKKKG